MELAAFAGESKILLLMKSMTKLSFSRWKQLHSLTYFGSCLSRKKFSKN